MVYRLNRKAKNVGSMKKVTLYSDGACLSNPGPGGWCAILIYDDGKKISERVLSGGETRTTNNRMELLAVISGLEALKESCEVEIYTDSKYVADGISQGWAVRWRANSWIKSDKNPALNPDLWERLLNIIDRHSVKFTWVKGHSGHEYNERCDEIASNTAREYKESI